MSPDPLPPVSDQTPTPEAGDLGPWCCYADEVGMYDGGVCTPEDPRHAPTHCGYDNVRRGLVPAPPAPTPEPPLSIADSDDPSPWADHPPTPSPVSPEDGEGVRSQTEQWFVVHHNQIRALRFAQFPIERLARASIAACTCGPHTLRHTVITTYTASDETEFVAARPSGAVS